MGGAKMVVEWLWDNWQRIMSGAGAKLHYGTCNTPASTMMSLKTLPDHLKVVSDHPKMAPDYPEMAPDYSKVAPDHPKVAPDCVEAI